MSAVKNLTADIIIPRECDRKHDEIEILDSNPDRSLELQNRSSPG